MLRKKYFNQVLSPIVGIVSMLFIAFIVTSCDKEMDVANTLEISELHPVNTAAGGTPSLDILSNGPWNVGNIEAHRVQLEFSEGHGTGRLEIASYANTTVH